MEVFRSEEFYIFVQDDVSLWWSRVNGEFLSKSGEFSIKDFRYYASVKLSSIQQQYIFAQIYIKISLYLLSQFPSFNVSYIFHASQSFLL